MDSFIFPCDLLHELFSIECNVIKFEYLDSYEVVNLQHRQTFKQHRIILTPPSRARSITHNWVGNILLQQRNKQFTWQIKFKYLVKICCFTWAENAINRLLHLEPNTIILRMAGYKMQFMASKKAIHIVRSWTSKDSLHGLQSTSYKTDGQWLVKKFEHDNVVITINN